MVLGDEKSLLMGLTAAFLPAGTTETLSFPKSNGQLEARGTVQFSVNGTRGSPSYQLTGKYTERLVGLVGSPQDNSLVEKELFRYQCTQVVRLTPILLRKGTSYYTMAAEAGFMVLLKFSGIAVDPIA